jgi:hypothetical protein
LDKEYADAGFFLGGYSINKNYIAPSFQKLLLNNVKLEILKNRL